MNYKAILSIMYPKDEIERIDGLKIVNDNLEIVFATERLEWNDKLSKIFSCINYDVIKNNKASKLIDAQGLSLNYRQDLNNEVRVTFKDISLAMSERSRIEQETIIKYHVDSTLSVKTKDIYTKLVTAHLRENNRQVELYNTHMEFLNQCIVSIDKFGYCVTNAVQLINVMGK